MKVFTKKFMIACIKAKLEELGIDHNHCFNVVGIDNVIWLSTTQVCMRKHIDGVLYRTYRVPLHSKNVTKEMLNEFDKQITNKLNYNL